jgi:hypothetical protein
MIAYIVCTRMLDVFYGLTAQPNPYHPGGAISCWNMSLPVVSGTMCQTIWFGTQISDN